MNHIKYYISTTILSILSIISFTLCFVSGAFIFFQLYPGIFFMASDRSIYTWVFTLIISLLGIIASNFFLNESLYHLSMSKYGDYLNKED